jgi:hypothetical protein
MATQGSGYCLLERDLVQLGSSTPTIEGKHLTAFSRNKNVNKAGSFETSTMYH